MGRIHVLSETVANQIAAGEVVERPASVVKEMLENSLDAGATRIRISVEAGGKKLIQITDNGCGMVRDDAMLAFERHATSKIKRHGRSAERGDAGISRRGAALDRFGVAAASGDARGRRSGGTVVEINGGKITRVEEAGLPLGTSITVRDLFFNTPARKKFLKSESTELSHIASLVTHYALAHPEKHFELHSATNAMLVAPPVAGYSERVYQVFGKETLDQLIPLAALQALERVGLPQPPPWRRKEVDEDGRGGRPQDPGEMRIHGFVSKPEIQKLNRNSIFVFVNGRLIRDRLMQHALTEAYRNIIPPTVYPVVLLFLEMPAAEVDVNVHPSKTEVRFRQQTVMHDFVRDSVRAALMKARPVPQFVTEMRAHATASQALTPGRDDAGRVSPGARVRQTGLREPGTSPENARNGAPEILGSRRICVAGARSPPVSARFQFEGGIAVEANAAVSLARPDRRRFPITAALRRSMSSEEEPTLSSLGTLKPLGQIRNSFILAVNEDGLWIIDQHVAHERVLFERVLKQRAAQKVESQRLLMPMVLELSPAQQAVFTEIADELQHNGFEAEPFGARSVAVKVAPAGVDAAAVEHMLHEILDQFSREEQSLNLEKMRARIAASIACHAAIKVNMPLEQNKMEWLLAELAKTDHPMTCPHGRPVVLRYSMKDIQKAFKRI